MNKFAIVLDSAADIPASLVEKYGLHVVPLHVTFGTTEYSDGVDIEIGEFLNRLEGIDELPITSQPAPADFIGCSFTRGFSMAFRARIRPVFAGQPDTGRLLGHDWLIACAAALCGGFACLNEKLALYRSHGENFSIAGAGKRRMIDAQRRLLAVQMCLDAHEALRAWSDGLPHADAAFRSALARHIAFERRRLRFLRGRNPVRWLALGAYLGEYRRFYRTWGGALTIWAGDLMYTYRPARRKEDGR